MKKDSSKLLKEISKSEINELAKKYISPDKMVIIVVGSKYVIKKSLKELGYGKVKEISLD